MRVTDKKEALRLRIEEQLSYSEITKRLNVPKSTLSGWLKNYPLSKKKIAMLQHSEASREKFRNTMRQKREAREQEVYQTQRKKLGALSRQSVYTAGLMLYLAEGGKTNYSTISLANTDPNVIRFFISWLETFLHIPKSKLKIGLHLYEGMDIAQERAFWKRALSIENAQFYKDQIRPLRKGSFSYNESFRHGTCQVYFHGVKQKMELMLAIKAFFDTYNEREHTSRIIRKS